MTFFRQLMVWLGGAGLLTATLTDVVGVIGRHIGVPLHGTIEIVQAAVLVTGSLALIAASITGSHAQVHVLLDRLPKVWRPAFEWLSVILSFAFFGSLLAGSVWIAWDMWGGNEQSELLGIPWSVLRAFANLALIVILLAMVGQRSHGRPS